MRATTLSGLAVLIGLVAPSVAYAQSTQESLTLGGEGARGCDENDPPRLSDGSLASGLLDLDYDASTNILTLVATNTSEVQDPTFNPLLTSITFNLPKGAIDDVQLLSQSPSGPALPIYRVSVDLDRVAEPNLRMDCLGNFGVKLFPLAGLGGVGNADASRFLFPPPLVIEGPVTFKLRLIGPGADFLVARTIARGFSVETDTQVHAAFRFEWAGSRALGRGVVSEPPDFDDNECTIWPNSPPQIGQRIDLCFRGPAGVHGCAFGSFNPVPVTIGPFEVPIGLPITMTLLLPPFPENNTICLSVRVPDDVNLIGLLFYMTVATASAEELLTVKFSPRVNIAFLE